MIVYLVIAKLTTCSHYLSVTFCRRFCVLLANILVCICDLCSKNVKSTLHVKSTAIAQQLCTRITQYYVTSSARSGRDQSCGNLNNSFLCVGVSFFSLWGAFSQCERPFFLLYGPFSLCGGPFSPYEAFFWTWTPLKKLCEYPCH